MASSPRLVAFGSVAYPGYPPRAAAASATTGTFGLLCTVSLVGTPGRRKEPHGGALGVARADPRRVQRARHANHVAALRIAAEKAGVGTQIRVVCAAGIATAFYRRR